jgi:hypothetical protein
VLFYHEKFHAEKAISLVLSLWGFFSYFYGELQQKKKKKKKKKKHYTRSFAHSETMTLLNILYLC